MKNIIMRWALSAASIAASFFIPGIRIEGSNAIITVFLFAIILGLVNALLRPLTAIASIGLIVTFGLFLLVINALMLWSASYVAVNWFNIGFYVDGFWPAFWGAILISIFSVIFQQVLKEKIDLKNHSLKERFIGGLYRKKLELNYCKAVKLAKNFKICIIIS